MPHKIIMDDIFEEMINEIVYIKLNNYIKQPQKNK